MGINSSEVTVINIDDLESVFDIYNIKINARATAAISNLSYTGTIIKWTMTKDDLPEEGQEVFVVADMRTEHGILINTIEKAKYIYEEGWMLINYPDISEFDIKKWAVVPA